MSLLLDLPKHVEQQMEAYVAAGEFRSTAEVVEAAMGLLIDRMAHEKLRVDIAAGTADIAAGQVAQVDFDAIKRDGRAILVARQDQPQNLADMLRDYNVAKINDLTKGFLTSPSRGREMI